jgi:hypothetical protein
VNWVVQDKKARKLTKKRVRPCSVLACRERCANACLLVIVQLGTMLRSKRKLEELSNIIQESRRAGH